MKQVSLQDLKRSLFTIVMEAGRGEEIVITVRGKPVARLLTVVKKSLRTGARFGKAKLSAVLKGPSRGRYLQVLAEDRKEVREKA